jgi:hypothetical protein
MDLKLYFRVISRFKYVVIAGLALACLLAFFSVFHVSLANGFNVSYRQGQTYLSEEQLYLNTRGGVPFRTTTAKTDPKTGQVYYPPNLVPPSSLSSSAILYAQLVNSDLLKPVLGKLPGAFVAFPVATRSNPPINLPFLAIDGFGKTPRAAIQVAKRVSQAFRAYVAENQRLQKVPAQQRVLLTVIKDARTAIVSKSRHFSVPIIVFLVMVILTLGLVFLLENLRPRHAARRERNKEGVSTEPVLAPAVPVAAATTAETETDENGQAAGEPRQTRRPSGQETTRV